MRESFGYKSYLPLFRSRKPVPSCERLVATVRRAAQNPLTVKEGGGFSLRRVGPNIYIGQGHVSHNYRYGDRRAVIPQLFPPNSVVAFKNSNRLTAAYACPNGLGDLV